MKKTPSLYSVMAGVFVVLALLALGQVGIHATLTRIEYKIDALLRRGDL